MESLVVPFVWIAPCPVTGHHQEQSGSPFVPFHQIFICTDKFPP